MEILHVILPFDSQENHEVCCHQMSDFKAKMHQISAGDPAFLQTPSLDLRRPTSKRGKGGKWKGTGEWRMGGSGQGRQRMGKEGRGCRRDTPWFLLTPPDMKSWIKH